MLTQKARNIPTYSLRWAAILSLHAYLFLFVGLVAVIAQERNQSPEELTDLKKESSRNYVLYKADSSVEDLQVGRRIPQMRLMTIAGDVLTIDSTNHKPLVISFWDKRCVPCLMELDQLNMLYKRYSGKVTFIAITPNTKADLNEFLSKRPFEFTLIPDGQEVIKRLKVSAFPLNILTDENGVVTQTVYGVAVKRNPDGSPFLINGEPVPLVFDNFSKVIESILKP